MLLLSHGRICCQASAELLADENIEVEIIDLRTIIPFDAQTCIDSVIRTGRLVILQEG